MKFTITKEQLQSTLTLASRFSSTKLGTNAILQGVLVEAGEGLLTLFSSNLTQYFKAVIEVKEIKEVRSMIIEPRKVLEFINLLPGKNVDIEITDKNIILSHEKSKGTFPLLSSEDFPKPPSTKVKTSPVPKELFTKTIPFVTFSASKDETRPVLTGVLCKKTDEGTVFVTTDGFRLSHIKSKYDIGINEGVLPSIFLEEVGRYISSLTGKINIEMGFDLKEKLLIIVVNKLTFYTRLLDGQFPAYERVIPTQANTTILVEVNEFIRAIKLVSIFARDFSNIVVLEVKKNGLLVRPKGDLNGSNTTQIEALVEGEEMYIAFNYRYLIDLLSRIETEHISIKLLRPESPATFVIPKNDDFFHLIMPVRIQE